MLFTYSYYQLPDFLKSVSTAPYRTPKPSILRLFTSQRGDHTAWRGLPSSIYPKSPGISILTWENSATNTFFPVNSNIRICTLQALSSLLYYKGQHQTGTKDKTQAFSVAALSSWDSGHNICPGLPAGNGTSHRHFTALQIFLRKIKQTRPQPLYHCISWAKANAQNSILTLNIWLHANSKCNKRLPQSIWIPFQHGKHKHLRTTVLLSLEKIPSLFKMKELITWVLSPKARLSLEI